MSYRMKTTTEKQGGHLSCRKNINKALRDQNDTELTFVI